MLVTGLAKQPPRPKRIGSLTLPLATLGGPVTAGVEDVAKVCLAHSISDFLLLPELLASFGHLGYDVVEMVLADQDGWDRYEAAKWLTMRRWLDANPDDAFASVVRAQLTSEPVRYATYTREFMGWGVFALMKR